MTFLLFPDRAAGSRDSWEFLPDSGVKKMLPQLDAQQIMNIGRVNSHKCMEMILRARRERNLTRDYINGLSSRHRGLIYFHSGISPLRNNLKFEALTTEERKKIIHSLRDLRELFELIPASLSDTDSDI